MTRDSYYTSTSLAERLVNYVADKSFSSVVDFCVGDGELLRAAQLVWKDIKCYGVDISQNVITNLRSSHPSWCVKVSDFTDSLSRKKCSVTNKKKYDLILLNPPFTCKGSTVNKITLHGKEYKVSTAMMFIVEALQYMHDNSILLAILPVSCAYSQKDRKIWRTLVDNYQLKILEEIDKQSFKKCNPNIILVSINDKSNKEEKEEKKKSTLNLKENNFTIFRGNLSVHECFGSSLKNGKPFVHTTNLINNSIQNVSKYSFSSKSEVSGPAVLISRVGNPSIKKICSISKKETYVISDCIIAIKTNNDNEADKLKQLLIDNWDSLKALYKGTAAKYITIERLYSFLGI